MSDKITDFLVVGQGIAGTLFSWKLYSEGRSFRIINSGTLPSSTQAAAGLMNPITGKFLALSWEYDALYPLAISTYSALMKALGMNPITSIPIVRGLRDQRMINDWSYRSTQERYAPFIGTLPDLKQIWDRIKTYPDYGATRHSFQVPISTIKDKWHGKLQEENLLIEEDFNHELLSHTASDDTYVYRKNKYRHIVFCEGSHVMGNPYFNHLPFDPAKGDVLLVKIPDWPDEYIYKDQLFIAPWHKKGVFWVGSNYEWQTDNWNPTEDKRQWLIRQFESMYQGSYEIIGQLAGIRPAVKDRKPILGEHPQHPGMYLFNGLGTKGTSLGPHCADVLYRSIQTGHEIPDEISIRRFYKN